MWYLVRCLDCDITLPFADVGQRDDWASVHAGVRDPWTQALHQVQVAQAPAAGPIEFEEAQ